MRYKEKTDEKKIKRKMVCVKRRIIRQEDGNMKQEKKKSLGIINRNTKKRLKERRKKQLKKVEFIMWSEEKNTRKRL